MKRMIYSLVMAVSPLGLALAQTAAPPASPAQPADSGNGAAIFQEYCASCHGRGPGHPGTAALSEIFGPAKASLLDNNLSAALVKTVVRHGLAQMPPLRPAEISDNDLNQLANYLASGPHPAEGAAPASP